MATYNIESFYRTTLQGTILASDTVATITAAGGLKVFNTPLGTYSSDNPGFVTVSPNTDNEEIFEFIGVNPTTKVLTISKRGINKSSITLTTDGAYAATGDYNNSSFMKDHTINDSVRGDINHIHINQNFSTIELKSTANGKGASQVGIEDAGNYFTSTNMEGALQEALSVLAPNVKATASVYGVSKMSVAPVSSTDPIAVGDNDDRLVKDYAIAYAGTNYTIAGDGSSKLVTLSKTKTNNSLMVGTANRIIIKKAGLYHIGFNAPLGLTGTTNRVYTSMAINGTVVYSNYELKGSGLAVFDEKTFSYNLVREFSVDDYIELKIRTDTGSTISITGGDLDVPGSHNPDFTNLFAYKIS